MLKQAGCVKQLKRLAVIYLFVAVFWSLFDQTGSSWVIQAAHMDSTLFGATVLPSQIQAANPLLILILTPLFFYFIYPVIGRLFSITPLRKISLGMILAGASFVLAAWLQGIIDQGGHPSIAWQLLDYLILTSSEVMVSITCLEYSYTEAPRPLKSVIMSFYLLSVAAGNLFTSLVNFVSHDPASSSKLDASYFWFFSVLMFLTAGIFSWLTWCQSADSEDNRVDRHHPT